MKGSVTIPIGGELESRATDGRVVSADGVYDYLIGASQEEINASVIGGQIQLEDCWDVNEYPDRPDDSSDSGSDS